MDKVRVFIEYPDGKVQKVSCDYIEITQSLFNFSLPYYYGGTIKAEFSGEIKESHRGVSIVETYFGEEVEFVFGNNHTICFLKDRTTGVAYKRPEDKYCKDYGKLLSYQRAKELQLYGSNK